jgi:hypothetical protein
MTNKNTFAQVMLVDELGHIIRHDRVVVLGIMKRVAVVAEILFEQLSHHRKP